jgi:class 3 adenylate cyclase/tetratricopeptide (TPR) repeat protein
MLGSMRICQACSTENPSSARFCAECGRPLGATCANCGEGLPDGARFCSSCGTPVPVAAEAPEEMLKLVTVLFADVVSSTRRAELMHPEDVRAQMSEFFAAMSEEIAREGGTVEKYIGDAVMAVFGVPAAHEDDPMRAVRAAERMQERLARFEPEPGAPPLEMRIGINTGDVVTGSSSGRDLLVTGDAVNVAARLQESAPPGAVLIGDRTARSIRGCFRLKPVEDLELRGRDGPMTAWIVSGEEDTAEPPRGPVLSAPMVGRDPELSVIRSVFDRVKLEGTSHLISVVGDAGVGKSRLVQEFIRALAGDERVVSSRCPPSGEGLTLWPLARILRGEAGILDSDPPELAYEKLGKVVAKLNPELVADGEQTVAAFAHTLGMEPNATNKPDPRSTLRQLIEAWRALLRNMSQSGALVVLIEDLHWADQTMLDILAELSERPLGTVLFLCTARPELLRNRSTWGAGSRNYSSVSLDPLTEDESQQLISSLLGATDLPEEFCKRILRRAEGNPFFLHEILRSLIDEGSLRQSDGRWVPSEKLAEVEIPDDVQAVILSRIDLLEPAERRVLQQASVVGRNFWIGAVSQLTGIDDLSSILRNLQQREFVVERLTSSISGELEFSFKHVLIRDVAYQSLPRRARGQAHAALASWIEHIGKRRFRERAELLAYHYAKAYKFLDDDEFRIQARKFSMAASTNAYRKAASERAEWYGRRAVDLSCEPAERVEALEFLGEAHLVGDPAYRAFREAMTIIEDSEPTDKVVLGRLTSQAAIIPTRYRGSMLNPPPRAELVDLIDRGMEDASDADRARLLAARAFMQLMAYEDLTDDGRQAVRESLEIAEQVGDADLISLVLDAVAGCHMYDGRYGEALRVHQRRYELLNEVQNPGEATDTYGMLAWACTVMGRYTDAIGYATTGSEFALDVNPGGRLHSLAWRAQARFMMGDWDGALGDQAEIEEINEGLPGNILAIPYSLRAYAIAMLIHELRGNDERATSYFELLERSTADLAPGVGPTEGGMFVARYLMHAGDADGARATIAAGRTKFASFQLEATMDLIAAEPDWERAPEVVATARESSGVGELEGLPAYADRLEGRHAAALGNMATAESRLRSAVETFGRVGAGWERAVTQLDLGEILLESGRRGEAETTLRAALSEFRRLRSVKEEDRAERLLAKLTA